MRPIPTHALLAFLCALGLLFGCATTGPRPEPQDIDPECAPLLGPGFASGVEEEVHGFIPDDGWRARARERQREEWRREAERHRRECERRQMARRERRAPPAPPPGEKPHSFPASPPAGPTFVSISPEAPASPVPVKYTFGKFDVVREIFFLRKPGAVGDWWVAGPGEDPKQWTHPLSSIESLYIQAMGSPRTPEPIRMKPPVDPRHPTAEQLGEAEQRLGKGPDLAQRYANFENRRRIVVHYIFTHPATVALELEGYRMARDTHPLLFALERGWEVGSGKEMLTGEDKSRLGAAAEFFLALGPAVASEGLATLASRAGRETVTDPGAPPGLKGKVIPLKKQPEPGVQSPPAEVQEPLLGTGTDGPLAPTRGHGGEAPVASLRRTGDDGAPGGSSRSPQRPAPPSGQGEPSAGAEAGARPPPRLRAVAGEGEAIGELTEARVNALKFKELEQAASDGRLLGDAAWLRSKRPTAPPPGLSPDDPLWVEHLRYYEARVAEIAEHEKGLLPARPKNPLGWEKYKTVKRNFLRGIEHQQDVKGLVLSEQGLASELREFTQGMDNPRVDGNMGVQKGAGNTNYVDISITDLASLGPGKTPSVAHVSCKSVDFTKMSTEEIKALVRQHAKELNAKYGGRLEIRRPGHPLFGEKMEVTQLHLVYDAEYVIKDKRIRDAILEAMSVLPEIKVHFK